MVSRIALAAVLTIGSAQILSAASFAKSMLVTTADDSGKTQKIDGILRVESDKVLFIDKKDSVIFSAPYSSVSKLVYERTKKPRYSAGLLLAWPLLFTKEKQHYLTVEADGKYAFVKLHKDHYRAIIAALESSAGRSVERLAE